MDKPFLKLLVLKVSQPLGVFYLTKIKVEDLDKIAYSSELRPNDGDSASMNEFVGSQRSKKMDKLKQIGRYIDSSEAAFPNTIILAANYTQNGKLTDDDSVRWSVDEGEQGFFYITIPTRERLAAIVDGQHRLDGFKYAENSNRWLTELACAIYIDLPNPYQAYLFASINHNQTPVSKSLSYILYGYNLDDETIKEWSPEKLAVFISRQLNSEDGSPFYKRIKVPPQIDKILMRDTNKSDWAISTATIVEGILNLISIDPGRDRDELAKTPIKEGRNRQNLSKFKDESPLRTYYLTEKDIVIKKAVENFFQSALEHLALEHENSFILKTIGIQALFDVLKESLKVQSYNTSLNISLDYFNELLSPLFNIDFLDPYLMQSSAIGRSRLKNLLLYALHYRTEFDVRDNSKPVDQRRRSIKKEDKIEFDRILGPILTNENK